jgi:hypothetical protein
MGNGMEIPKIFQCIIYFSHRCVILVLLHKNIKRRLLQDVTSENLVEYVQERIFDRQKEI